MEPSEKTKAQLIEEIVSLRERVAEFERESGEESLQGSGDALMRHSADLEERVRALTVELEKANEATQDINARFEAVYHHHHQLTGLLDTEGRLLLANKAALDFAGASERDVIGQIFIETPFWTHSQEEQRKLGEAIERVLAGEPARFDTTHVSAEGETRDFDFCLTPVFDEGGQVRYLVPAGNDITERKNAERALRASEVRYRNLVDTMQDIFYSVSADGTLEFIGPQVERYGFTAADLISKPFGDFIFPEDRDRVLHEFGHSATTGEQTLSTFRVVAEDGRTIWFEEIGQAVRNADDEIVSISGMLRDVTDRKAAEESLQKSERRFRSLFEQAGDYILVLAPSEDRGFVISDANEAACEVHGYTRQEFLGKPLGDLDTELDEEQIQATLNRVLAGEALLVETTHKKKDGAVFPIEASIGPLDVGEGSSLIVSFERDITERRRAAEERKKLEGQLRHSQKMEAIGQLAGGVAHDFNNLLQAILGYGEMALEEARPGSSLRDKMSEVMNAANRATTLVRQLLAFSRKQVLKLEILDLDEVVEELAKMIRRVIGEHIALIIQSEPGQKTVQADQGQLEQILMNLCVNARDAMPEGGRLTVTTENAELDADFCQDNGGAEPGSYVLLSVCDTGSGIDQEAQERIFEPFFTTKGEGKGTGLGLATVYGIVRQHHGMVHVHSEIGLGTTFKVYLPMSDSAVRTDLDRAPTPPPGGTEVVLLAEDDIAVRRVTGQVLEEAGYTVFTASDGEEAIRMFDLNANEIDLALLDVVMPKCSGRSVFQHIQEAGTQTSVLFSSGYTAGTVDAEFLREEGLELIQKPYKRDDLLRTVRKVLDS